MGRGWGRRGTYAEAIYWPGQTLHTKKGREGEIFGEGERSTERSTGSYRRPKPKVNDLRSSRIFWFSDIHLWGLKDSGSGKKAGSRPMDLDEGIQLEGLSRGGGRKGRGGVPDVSY